MKSFLQLSQIMDNVIFVQNIKKNNSHSIYKNFKLRLKFE